MFKSLRRLSRIFKRKYQPRPKELILHKSHVRGWPNNPSISSHFFPAILIIDINHMPTKMATKVVKYYFYSSTVVGKYVRATYVQQEDLSQPGFIWVFLTNK